MKLILHFTLTGAFVISALLGYVSSSLFSEKQSSIQQKPVTSDAQSPQHSLEASVAEFKLGDDSKENVKRIQMWVDGLPEPELPAAIRAALVQDGNDSRIARALYFRWLSLNPKAALENARAAADPDSARPLWRELFESWVQRDLAGAKSWAEGLSAGRLSRELLTYIAHQLSEKDPAGASRLFDQIRLPQSELNAVERLFAKWAEQDFSAAMTSAQTDDRLQSRRAKYRGLLKSMHAKNPAEVLQWIKNVPDLAFRNDATASVIKDWIAKNPRDAAEFIVDMDLGNSRKQFLESASAQLAKTDLNQAREFFETLNLAADRTSVLNVMMREWMARDPQGGTAFALSLPGGKERDAAIGEIIAHQRESNLDEVYQYLAMLPHGPERSSAVVRTAHAMARKVFSPAAADFCLAEVPINSGYNSSLARFISEWASGEPEAALSWIRKLPDGTTKSELAQSVLNNYLLRGNTEKAFARAMEFDPETLAHSTNILAANWGYRDTAAASDWISKNLPAGHARSNAFQGLARAWTNKGAPAAETWMGQLKGADYDAAASVVANSVAATNAPKGLELAARINDPRQKTIVSAGIAEKWKATDPNAARNWIQSTPLFSSVQKSRLLGNR